MTATNPNDEPLTLNSLNELLTTAWAKTLPLSSEERTLEALQHAVRLMLEANEST
jgi:hypothetical protein